MLNEWIETNKILETIKDCDFGVSHPYFRSCTPKKGGFIVFLDQNGHVEDVEIPSFKMEAICKWQKLKMDPSFPVFNGRAFYEVTCAPSDIPVQITTALKDKNNERKQKKSDASPEAKNVQKENINEPQFQAFLGGCNDLWKDDLELIGRCLKELPSELQKTYLEAAASKPAGYGAYKELVKRAGLCPPEKCRDEMRNIFIQKLFDTGKKEFAEVLFAFKKEGKKKGRGKEHGKDFLFLLSIKDWDNPAYGEKRFPPYHSTFQRWMAQTFEQHSKKLYKPLGTKDAFGLDMSGAMENYDDINAAGLGQIKLFAAYDKIPCLKRYGLESVKLFPAGRSARELSRKTLEYILNRSREGMTWISLRKYENRNTVAFAYCTKLTNTNAIKIFDSDDTEDQESIYISEEATKTALKTLEGIAESEPAAEIVIGIIASVDKGNTKILASRHYPLRYYISGARRWQEGCANIPDMGLPWLAKKEKAIKGTLPIYPTRAIWLLNSSWRQNGDMIMRKQGKQRVPISKRFASSDALDFLFERDDTIRARVDAGLENVIEKSANALIRAGLKAKLEIELQKLEMEGVRSLSITRLRATVERISFKDSEYLHMLPTLYGLLLHKKGIRKEDYMNEGIFDLGRYFAVVDDLYIQYHMDVRSGNVPMSLLGNDHLKLALQNPLDAFVSLSSRLVHPYMSWAKRVGTDERPGQIAKNCIRKIAGLTEELSKAQIPAAIDDVDRAKLLMGYLSHGAMKYQDDRNIDEQQSEKGE